MQLFDAVLTSQQMKDAGFSLRQPKEAGFNPRQLNDAGIVVRDLKDAGFSARQLLDAEITARQLFEDSFPLQQMKARFGIAQLNGRWHQQVATRRGFAQSQDPCGYRRRECQPEVPIEPRVGDYLKDSSA